MNYLLDTNIISAILKQNHQVLIKVRLAQRLGKKIFLSSMTYYEIKRGLLVSQASQKLNLFNQLLIDCEIIGIDSEKVLDKAATIYAHLKRQGELLPDADILIAATAQSHHLILVTDDSHFNRIDELQLENWVRK
ncbi:MAG: type II toxin-antitoxin system VapC family toxin [Thioploca sp.]|nr:type II toxin-antitoxin system VapC family toxin [Thioploca sp.]